MALFNWSNSYSVGVKEIDDQHKILIGLINDLHDGMKVGKGKEVMGGVLNELMRYTVFHFGYGEKILEKNSYPDIDAHKKLHKVLIEQVNKIKSDYDTGNKVLSMEVMSFLKDWLSNHIMGTDKKYTSHLNGKGIF
jgi:hemerythrin